MSDILEQIAQHKRIEVAELKASRPLERFVSRLPVEKDFRFCAALAAQEPVKIIAEIKKASPSKGVLQSDFNPEQMAIQYKAGGAAALSVLTDAKFFQGMFEYLDIAKRASGLPILCKDFIVDPYQLYYARYMGADAVLLIVRLLTRQALAEMQKKAHDLGLDCLVEVHTEGEVEVALDSGAKIIGVNSRNLADFTVSLDAAIRLGEAIPKDKIKVAESGIFAPGDIRQLRQAGYSCFLIGEALMKASDPAKLLQELQQA